MGTQAPHPPGAGPAGGPRLAEPLAVLLGARTARTLASPGLDLHTAGDLLRHYPRRYGERGRLTDLASLPEGEHVTVVAEVAEARQRPMRERRGSLLTVTVTDGSGSLTLTFFNPKWRGRELVPGRRGLFSGKVTRFGATRQLVHPAYELLRDDHDEGTALAFADALIPLYPATKAMSSWDIAKAVRMLLDTVGDVEDPLPAALRSQRGLLPLGEALELVHRPRSRADVTRATDRLRFDEAFLLQVALARRRQRARALPATPRRPRPGGLLDAFDARLPFRLTAGQRETGAEVAADLAAEHPMHRLLQGEVGSGKAQPLDALVLTPEGFRAMGDVHVGDEVLTPSGEVAVVRGVFPQGERPVWRVHFSDGSSAECDDDHLWEVRAPVARDGGATAEVKPLRELRRDLRTQDGAYRWHVDLPSAAEFDGGGERPLDPYLLGLLLGGGGPLPPGTCPRPAASGRPDAVVEALRDPGPLGRGSRGTSVPRAYLAAPVKARHAVLQGLLDTAGTPDRGGGTEVSFTSASRQLADDVAWLARSLGGWATCRPTVGAGRTHWRAGVALPAEHEPFRLARKARLVRARTGCAPAKAIDRVTYVGRRPVQCIAVSHPGHLYVTDDFTVTHNTLVALRGMLTVVDSGGQAALLAPTEVLAQQHHRLIIAMLGPLAQGGFLGGAEQGTRVALLTGSQGGPARRAALLDAAGGAAGIVVGTHALLQDPVDFADLGLVVVDEQHRFGVQQRDALRAKASRPPHLLVMTATPIPRTVAMTVFGDLDVSTLTELPGGRSPLASHVVPAGEKPHFLERAWGRVREEVAAGHQAFVVCPRIGDEGAEEPAAGDGPAGRPPLAVLDVAPTLREGPLAGLRLRVLHGRMPPEDKDEVMRAFAAGEVDVLVATTVIEVGIDVPNATVMLVLDADRFGVSQLHQLRGRVGRGSAPGVCLLVTDTPPGAPGRARVDAVAATSDGFELSRVDLAARREGDVLGAAQSGRRSSLKLLSVLRDEEVVLAARQEAAALVGADPELTGHPVLAAAVDALLEEERSDYLEKA